jgi:quercetin dioxygenase-like cupin family protein
MQITAWKRLPVFLLLVVGLPAAAVTQAPVSVPLGAGRPETPGITRTQIRDDAKSSVVRVRFMPGAKEVPHTHPYDIVIVPLMTSDVQVVIGSNKPVTSVKPGDIQYVPKDVPHHVANTGKGQLEFIVVAIK